MPPRWEPNPDIRTGRHVVHHLHVHLVFVTRYRRTVFDDEMLTRCEEIVHLLVHYPPKVALSNLVNSLKGVSSRRLRQEFTGRINRIGMGSVFWSRSCFAGSCGGAPLTVIRQYIEGQKQPT
ncbi:IS200/IS605 family transposase [Streptomyces yanii]|uniref:IS200/IS605 family transposase n=1 Tax=Streptomyces yanii TaxID=78510 RepID=A0ABV5R760_9ACTN